MKAFGPVAAGVLFALASGSPRSNLVPTRWEGEWYGCKCYFDNHCWPKSHEWRHLNRTVDGNLRLHVPVEAVCHDTFDGPLGTVPTYDPVACQELQSVYLDEEWNTEQDAVLMWKYFTNYTCKPTDDPSEPCTIGYYGFYVIDAQTKWHVKKGVDFAREHGLRLIIRNTGHDFIGRSTGWGALIINMHGFKDVDFTRRYRGPGSYRGGAVTVGAGVQGAELLALGHEQSPPLAMMTGECPTVGVAGGLVMGGGHGPWTTLKGFTADNALSFEVVTADGKFKTANERQNPDLFFALKGGGTGQYAVVLEATFKTWPDVPAAGAEMYLNFTHTTDEDVYWDGVRIFHKHANDFVDSGLYVYFEAGLLLLRVRPFVAIDKTQAELDAITAGMRAELDAASIPYGYASKEFPTVYDLYVDLFEAETAGAFSLTGGWTFTRQDVAANNDAIIDAFKTVVSPREDLAGQGFIVGHLWNAGYANPEPNSATHPAFRDASDLMISILPVPENATLEEKQDLQDLLTFHIDEQLRQAGPNGCAYVNEADPYQPDWQDHFWGPTYPGLVAIKEEWDPDMVFYSIANPGTEDWELIDYGKRLCKKY